MALFIPKAGSRRIRWPSLSPCFRSRDEFFLRFCFGPPCAVLDGARDGSYQEHFGLPRNRTSFFHSKLAQVPETVRIYINFDGWHGVPHEGKYNLGRA